MESGGTTTPPKSRSAGRSSGSPNRNQGLGPPLLIQMAASGALTWELVPVAKLVSYALGQQRRIGAIVGGRVADLHSILRCYSSQGSLAEAFGSSTEPIDLRQLLGLGPHV